MILLTEKRKTQTDIRKSGPWKCMQRKIFFLLYEQGIKEIPESSEIYSHC